MVPATLRTIVAMLLGDKVHDCGCRVNKLGHNNHINCGTRKQGSLIDWTLGASHDDQDTTMKLLQGQAIPKSLGTHQKPNLN